MTNYTINEMTCLTLKIIKRFNTAKVFNTRMLNKYILDMQQLLLGLKYTSEFDEPLHKLLKDVMPALKTALLDINRQIDDIKYEINAILSNIALILLKEIEKSIKNQFTNLS